MSSFTLVNYDDEGIVGSADDSCRAADAKPTTVRAYDFVREKREEARRLRERVNVLAANDPKGDYSQAAKDAEWAEHTLQSIEDGIVPFLTREQQAALAA